MKFRDWFICNVFYSLGNDGPFWKAVGKEKVKKKKLEEKWGRSGQTKWCFCSGCGIHSNNKQGKLMNTAVGFANAKAKMKNLKFRVHLKGFIEKKQVQFFLTLISCNLL